MKYLICLVAVCILSACSSVTQYQAGRLDTIEQAKSTLEKLTYSQHRAWRPDYIEIFDDHIGWGYGYISQGHGRAVAIGNIAVGSSTTRTRGTGERLYYDSIKDIQVVSWRRKFKQWYIASVVTHRGKRIHLLRTRYEEDAHQYVDALNTLVSKIDVPEIASASKEILNKTIVNTDAPELEAERGSDAQQVVIHQQKRVAQSGTIESKIDGEFSGFEGETIIKLMNGQVWQQTEYWYHYHYSYMPKVIIFRSGGGYKIVVDGIDKAVAVTLLN